MATIKLRNGTSDQWTRANPVLALGEPGYESDTHVLKVGDGLTQWTTLQGYLNETSLTEKFASRTDRLRHAPAFGLYYPEAEGAICDGIADDTQALINAIEACYSAGGGTVSIDGIVQVNPASSIEVPEGVRLVGTVEGRWDNYATYVAGSTIRLTGGSSLTSAESVLKYVYRGPHPDRRHTGGAFGITIHGNRDAGNAAQGILLSGVRFVHMERVYSIRNGSHGFASVTQATATSEMYFTNTFAGWNGGQGYRLFGGDSTITAPMAGWNASDGFYLGLAATAVTGASSWNNGRDGLVLASTASTQFLSILGGQYYDNDRAGITVEAPAGNAMLGNSIIGASCHGNGQQVQSAYAFSPDRAGIRVAGVHTPEMLAIHNVHAGNRTMYRNLYQQYGVALLAAGCNPTVSGVAGANALALWYLVDATAIPENQAGRQVPIRDNAFSIGRSSARWANFLGLRHTVFGTLNDAQPRAQLGSTAGAAELSFGAGGSTSPDWRMSRTAADVMALDPGDSLAFDGTWNGGTIRLGAFRLWVDSTGGLRIKNGTPSSDTDGTIVGTQT